MEKKIVIKKDWKFYLGLSFLFLSIILPLFGFFVPFLNLPIGVSAFIIGALTIGGPEVMIALAAICLGKDVLIFLKQKFFKLIRRKKKIKPVSRFRYYFGLFLLFGSALPLYLNAYASHLLPEVKHLRYYILIGADSTFVLSFFILGGNFWEKFKKLFIWDAPKEHKNSSIQ